MGRLSQCPRIDQKVALMPTDKSPPRCATHVAAPPRTTPSRSRTLGEKLGQKLQTLKAKHPSIGDVRGRGLFWAVELVKDRTTRTPFNTQREKLDGKPLLIDQVTAKMMQNGVSCLGWISHLVIAPPLIITEA